MIGKIEKERNRIWGEIKSSAMFSLKHSLDIGNWQVECLIYKSQVPDIDSRDLVLRAIKL